MSLLMENSHAKIGCGDPGDPIDFGCLFANQAYLYRDFAPGSSRTRLTISLWLKLWGQGALAPQALLVDGSVSNTSGFFYNLDGGRGFSGIEATPEVESISVVTTPGSYRDAAAFLHAMYRFDAPNNVHQIFVGGKLVASLGAGAMTGLMRHNQHRIGTNNAPAGYPHFADVVMADYIVLDGVAADPDDFGYFNIDNVWVPKTFEGKGLGLAAYGLNGFHLDFADALDLGKDVSGNGNHFTAIGLTADNQVTDTPTNDFAVLNVSNPINLGPGVSSLSDGNLKSTGPAAANSGTIHLSTIPAWKGKIYAEVHLHAVSSANANVALLPLSHQGGWPPPSGVVLTMYGSITNSIILDGITIQSGLPAWGNPDICGVEVDLDAHTVQFYRDDVPYGSLVSGIANVATAIGIYTSRDGSGNASVAEINYGQKPFTYPRGADFLTLSSQNMPCPEILDPSQYYQREESIGGADLALNWNPLTNDTIVLTNRVDSPQELRVNMVIDGVQVNPFNTAGTGGEIVGEDGMTFNTVGAAVGAATEYQGTRRDRAFRCTPRSGMALVLINHLNGTPTVVDHTAGGVAEEITFFPVDGGDRRVFHKDIGDDAFIRLNASGQTSDPGFISGNVVNQFVVGASMPSGTYAAWVKVSVPQFSKVFSYEGNNSETNGAFLPFDFEAALVMGRRAVYAGAYFLKDNAGSNPNTEIQRLDGASNISGPGWDFDFYSNGSKWFSAVNETNDGGLYVGFAIAKTPIKFSNAV